MKYTQLRLDCELAKKGRLYRVILAKSDIKLDELGAYLVFIFEGTMEHYFLYHTKTICYEAPDWIEDHLLFPTNIVNKDYTKHTLKDLPDVFTFEYDTGEGWTFKCKKQKKSVEKISKKKVIVLEGAGMGIFEDNRQTFEAYIKGKLKKTFKKSQEELEDDEEYYLPWNLDMKQLGDFDKPLDIDYINDGLEEQVQDFISDQLLFGMY